MGRQSKELALFRVSLVQPAALFLLPSIAQSKRMHLRGLLAGPCRAGRMWRSYALVLFRLHARGDFDLRPFNRCRVDHIRSGGRSTTGWDDAGRWNGCWGHGWHGWILGIRRHGRRVWRDGRRIRRDGWRIRRDGWVRDGRNGRDGPYWVLRRLCSGQQVSSAIRSSIQDMCLRGVNFPPMARPQTRRQDRVLKCR
jgi:hypothetical protein